MDFSVGSIVEGKVTGITKFGAFVEMENGKTGLVHISEIAKSYVKDINDCLKENDVVKVKILNIEENGKIGLSIKQAVVEQTPSFKYSQPAAQSANIGFEDKLARFMKDSNEKLVTLKRHQEGRKGR